MKFDQGTNSIYSSDSKQPIVLITGLPRSGTTWLVQSLNLHPKILAFGEAHFFTQRWVRPLRNGRYSPAQLEDVWQKMSECPFWSSVPLKENLGKYPGWFSQTSVEDLPEVIASARRIAGSDATPSDVLDSIGRAFCEREGKEFWVEKTATEGKNVLSTAKKIPDARFILTMREPMGFLRSYKYQGVQLKDKSRKMHAARYHPFAAACVWRLSHRSILKIQAKHPDRVSVVVLSDDQARREALQEICRHVGVEPDDAMYRMMRKKINSSDLKSGTRLLDRSDLAWIRFFCRVDDPRLKIDEDLADIGVLDLFKSMLTIPFWAIRYLSSKLTH